MADPRSWAVRSSTTERAVIAPVAPDAPVPFWSAVSRSYEDGWETRRRNARYEATDEALWERHREIERRLGRRVPLSRSLAGVGPGQEEQSLLDRFLFDPERINAAILGRPGLLENDAYEALIEEERRKNPRLLDGVPTRAQVTERLTAEFTETRRQADEAAGSGWQGAVGSFVGGTGAYFSDPANAGTALATGGLGAGRGLLMRMGAQAAVGGGQEALDAPGRARDAARYGGPAYTARDAALDVAFGAAGGAGFEALGSGLAAGWRAGRARWGGSTDPAERGLSQAIDQLDADEATIGAGRDFDAARQSLAQGGPLPSVPPERDLSALFGESRAGGVSGGVRPMQRESPGGLEAAEYYGRQVWQGRFDPLTLDVDAARFQYKADGDAEGVTGRLRGVERWDATASGKAIVFEDTDGRLIVADGHQRRGLARRLAEQGWEDAQLDGYLFRARDGWSAGEVRVVAALKNVREGSGTVLDAAKLFREAPGALKDRSLPITGEVIQHGRQLASLSEPAFRAVVNGVIPERYGAVIGEQAAERGDLHDALVDLLRRADPRTVEGARAMVQEGLLDDFIKTEGLQLDLFGGLPRESTVIARGRIREAVLTGLRKDERLNAALVRNAEAIEAGGNVLARSENEARLAVDRAASELVSRLALRSGEMGEAFANAAAAVTKGETTPGAVAKGLIQRIRAAVKAGEALEVARAEVLDPPAPSAVALDAVAAFDVPGGPGQRAQLQPKPEEADLEGEAAPPGLFDDMPEDDGLDRAVQHLAACAPGRG